MLLVCFLLFVFFVFVFLLLLFLLLLLLLFSIVERPESDFVLKLITRAIFCKCDNILHIAYLIVTPHPLQHPAVYCILPRRFFFPAHQVVDSIPLVDLVAPDLEVHLQGRLIFCFRFLVFTPRNFSSRQYKCSYLRQAVIMKHSLLEGVNEEQIRNKQ